MQITEKYLPFGNWQTYCRIVGEATDRAPLLLLHGGPGSSHNYFEVLDQVAEKSGRQVIMYDQLGCGNSSIPDDQAETDRLWHAMVDNGGQESACGWCKDRWGISWQITPVQLTRAWTHPDRAAAKRAFDAMMTMKKIDVAAIEAAVAGR